jgi:hypothetical protein
MENEDHQPAFDLVSNRKLRQHSRRSLQLLLVCRLY